MPDDTYDDDLDDEPEVDETNAMRAIRRQLKEAKREAAALREQAEKAAALERNLAFREAGIDPNDPQQQYFAKGYDGEMTADAVRQAAIAAGFLKSDTPGPDVLAEHAAAARASVGGQTPDPAETRDAEYLAAMQGARSQQELLDVIRQYRPELVVPAVQ